MTRLRSPSIASASGGVLSVGRAIPRPPDFSAPVPRIGTQTLTATGRLGFSLYIGMTGSCVPYRSLSQGHAAFMPDAGWVVGRLPPTLARGIEDQIPVSTSVKYVTTRHQRFRDWDLAEQIGVNLVAQGRLRGVGPAIDRLDAHAPHQRGDMLATNLD